MNKLEAREFLKQHLKDYVESITQRSKGTNMYVCPLCGSGTGSKHSGAFSIKNGVSWKCFSCNKGGDIFDIIGEYEGILDHTEQLKRACNIYGIEISTSFTAQEDFKPEYQNQYKNEQYTHTNIYTNQSFKDFFLQAHNNIKKTDYPERRGLSKDIVDRFKLGYVAEWKHPKAPNATPTPRLIIPITEYSYIARDIRDTIPEEQEGYKKSKVKGAEKVSWTFNRKALKEANKPIIIVEGEIDALSVIEVGGEAVAIGSTANTRAFIELLKTERPEQPLIIALDNDAAGEKASKELEHALNELKTPFYRLNIAGRYKDPNEALKCNREAFKQAVEEAERIQEEAEQAQREAYLKNSTASYIQGFINGITDSVNTPCIPTGFNKLDETLDGGLYEGLYCVGAISSLGKTTVLLQIADQIAQSGKDILIFSLEMARAELMAKSISRHTLQQVLNDGGNIQNAKTARGITTGKRYINYSKIEKELINCSIMEYSKYAQHIFISEGIGDIGAQQIRETVKKHILYTGNTPIVIIDYLQILAPYSDRATDKQNTDRAVMELKRVSRDYKTAVIGVSSFNRANYKEAVTMEAFKESGAIEYSSDVLIGLQLKGAGGKDFNSTEAKKKNPREIELVILKNRNGSTGEKIEFKFYPLFNYFEEI